MTKFMGDCAEAIWHCFLTCGFATAAPSFRCKPNQCNDLCCSNENTCICSVFDNDTGVTVVTNITPNTTKEQCEAMRETLKKQHPKPRFDVGCIFGDNPLK
jgi:hypothetical protein